ncbi:MAG: GspE/PulE family protein [Bacillota bacterium]
MAKKLGQILVNNNYITEDELQKALKEQEGTGKKLGQVLRDLDLMSSDDLIEVLEYQLGVSHVRISDFNPDPELADLIPENMARRYQTVPLELTNDQLKVAMADPTNLMAVDDLKMLSGFKIVPHIATAEDIAQALDVLYSGEDDVEEVFESLSSAQSEDEDGFEPDELKEMVEDAPIVRLTNMIINESIKLGASDIHIEPQEDEVRVRYRVDGVLQEGMSAPKHSQAALISRLKIVANLDITKRRIPQDGRVTISKKGMEIDMRVSTLPTINGEKVVIRLLNKDEKLMDINNLGFSATNYKKFAQLISQPHGIILATGPTGSGKSTTLFAALNKLNTLEKNIVTIEDPVEFQIKGINQVQAKSEVGRGFAETLRSILRQDPDIIMVGEIRDKETAQIAIRAALTGHLVLSTLHTNDAVSSITRLIDMGIPSYLVASTVKGVIAQRLVRRLCKKCSELYTPEPEEKEALDLNKNMELKRAGDGCTRCNNSAYKGRIALQEILVMDQVIKKMVLNDKDDQEIKNTAINRGMVTLKDDGKEKIISGLTSYEEMMRVII